MVAPNSELATLNDCAYHDNIYASLIDVVHCTFILEIFFIFLRICPYDLWLYICLCVCVRNIKHGSETPFRYVGIYSVYIQCWRLLYLFPCESNQASLTQPSWRHALCVISSSLSHAHDIHHSVANHRIHQSLNWTNCAANIVCIINEAFIWNYRSHK